MAKANGSSNDGDLSREIQLFSARALDLAKAVVDGTATDYDREAARELASQIPQYSERAREMAEHYRASASKALADARLDLAFVAADGKLPSSARIGWYIQEREAGAQPADAE